MTTNRPTRTATPLVLMFAAALCTASVAPAYFAGGGKDAEKGNDCLIGYEGIDAGDVTLDGTKQVVTCMDCDPACDADGVASANGSCTFELSACINEPGVTGCTPPAGLDKAKASAKVKGVKGKIIIDVPQLLEGSVCGALLDLDVPTKETKNGPKDGKGTVSLKASVKPDGEKKRSDKDKITVVCTPLPEGQDCPIPTTTTSTSSTTSTSLPPCGNGTIDAGETCDETAAPNGCATDLTCLDCSQCLDCVPPGASPTTLTFTTGPGTSDCGSVGFYPTPAAEPYTGTLNGTSCTCAAGADCGTGGRCVEGHCAASTGSPQRIACSGDPDCATGHVCEASAVHLGLGCLYIGGGISTVPGGVTPDGAPSTFAVTQVCQGGNTLVLGGAATGGLDCTAQDGPTMYCANGHPGTDGNGACTGDVDCRPLCVNNQCVNGAPGPPPGEGACASSSQCGSGAEGTPGSEGLVCLPTANCSFGPPLPVKNGPVSTCVQNVFDQDASGSADIAAGTASLSLPLSSRVHFTSTSYPNGPCPTCQGGVCDEGPNQGQPCTGVGIDGTTHDCPPDPYSFLAPLSVTLDPLTTGVSSLPADGSTSPDGVFCPSQAASGAGAFTVPAARSIVMQGTPVAGGLDTTAKDAVLSSAFCIPRTGNFLIDGAANLPGPGATSLGGTLQLQ